MIAQQQHGNVGQDELFDTIVIGGGQAGLAAGYFLKQQDENFVILDENQRTGDSWRNRWDSLRLFTPSQFDSLPAAPFQPAKNYFPTKDEVADYLENYVRRFDLPVRYKARVESLSRSGQDYRIEAEAARFTAKKVIVATGPFQRPYTPGFASQIDPGIMQLHSSEYCNPGQTPVQSVLVVGAGNSGAEIAIDLAAAGKQVWLAGRDVGRVPASSPLGQLFDGRLIWWFMSNILTIDTPIGRRMHAEIGHHGTPLGRLRREEIAEAGVTGAAGMAGVEAGKPQLEDGRTLIVDGIVWATGFRPDYNWIDLPVIDEGGYPRHKRGVAEGEPGLYFVGLLFQSGLSSSLLGGVSKDAAYIAARAAGR